ncbi:MAG: alpha/beta hydrolase [Rhodobacteraceae bacterium]|nr:alpha/beta hydrolase [Paracoccaceae bacterium]
MQLLDSPENPVPEGARCEELLTSDGVRLRYARWSAAGGTRLGTVTIAQGRAEFIEKYFEVISELRSRGFDVVAFDWRGQGGSQRLVRNRNKGHVGSFEEYKIDLRSILKSVVMAEYPGPHFILAHSTGCAVVLADSRRLRTMAERAVLCSPLVGLMDGGRRERLVFAFAKLLSLCGLSRMALPRSAGNIVVPFDGNRQTRDPKRFARFQACLEKRADLAVGPPTVGWLRSAVKTLLSFRTREFGPSMVLPSMVIASGADRIVSTRATEELVSRMKAAGYIEIADAEHELLQERDVIRQQFWAAFDAFVPGQVKDDFHVSGH